MSREENIYSLEEDIKIIGEYLQEISLEVIKEKISNYPIFVAHQEESIQMGKPIIDAEKTRTVWSFNASLLEEFTSLNIFDAQKIDAFKQVFKDPKDFACVFLATPNDMDFVFIPFNLNEETESK